MSDPFQFITLELLRAFDSPIISVITADMVQDFAEHDCAGSPTTNSDSSMWPDSGEFIQPYLRGSRILSTPLATCRSICRSLKSKPVQLSAFAAVTLSKALGI